MAMPMAILNKALNHRISLLLKDGRIIEGKLIGYDDYMNMVLEDSEERHDDNVRKLGKMILRGNNVVSISPLE